LNLLLIYINLKLQKLIPTTVPGIQKFISDHKTNLDKALVVLEVTGGYEKLVIKLLQDRKIAVHRANGRQVKSFIRSHGIIAKSDAIDAVALALYAAERHHMLELYQVNIYEQLRELNSRRSSIVKIRAQEKNRAKAPSDIVLHKSFMAIMTVLDEQIALIDSEIKEIIALNTELETKIRALKTVPGIGDVIAVGIVSHMPEIGTLSQKRVASLAGVAPHPNQSGKKEGYRRCRGGRRELAVLLHMAALTASRSNSRFGDFYNSLVERGKAKLCALTALKRKLIVVGNARIKAAL
jgi:transposase